MAATASYDSGMATDALPCLDLLEATPAILRGLMAGISEEDALWKPAADRFSIAEVLSQQRRSRSGLRAFRGPAPDQPRAAAQPFRRRRRAQSPAQGRRRDHPVPDAARVGAPRPRAHPAGCGARPGPQVPRRSGPPRSRLPAQALTGRRLPSSSSTPPPRDQRPFRPRRDAGEPRALAAGPGLTAGAPSTWRGRPTRTRPASRGAWGRAGGRPSCSSRGRGRRGSRGPGCRPGRGRP